LSGIVEKCVSRIQLLYAFIAIAGLKAILLLMDSRPAYFFGDSGAYLATATTKWIPSDRSFLYGYLLRRIAYHSHSLEAMIVVQVVLSAIAAWLLCFALAEFFDAPFFIAAAAGLFCALEPMQLLAERYVMTDSVATALFAIYFVLVLQYVRRGSTWILLVFQAVGVLLIGIRISFLPAVIVNSFAVPLVTRHASKPSTRNIAWGLIASLAIEVGLLSVYAHSYGRLIHREPALFYGQGAFLIADFAPLIEPEDFPVSSARTAIFDNLRFDRHDPAQRSFHHFADGGLWANVEKEFPDPKQANDLAASTAIHALLRQPFRAAELAAGSLAQYFHPAVLGRWLLDDEGAYNDMSEDTRESLQRYYSVPNPNHFEISLTKKWHQFAIPWYWIVLCSLALSPGLLFICAIDLRGSVFLCVLSALLFLEGATLTIEHPTPRFLTTAAWLTLLMIGAAMARTGRTAAGEF